MNESNDKFGQELMEKADRLQTSVTPERDLWPGIEQAIQAPTERAAPGRTSIWAQAAAVVLLVGASSALTYSVVKNDGSSTVPVVPPSAGLVFEPVSGSFGSQYTLGPDYQDARRTLAQSLEGELEFMDADTRAAVETNIEVIRTAIRDINIALADDPDNALLQELLLNAYQDELNLMKSVDGMANAAMRRDDI